MTHKEELLMCLKKMGFNPSSQDEVDGTSSVFIKSTKKEYPIPCRLSFFFNQDGEFVTIWSDGDNELHEYNPKHN